MVAKSQTNPKSSHNLRQAITLGNKDQALLIGPLTAISHDTFASKAKKTHLRLAVQDQTAVANAVLREDSWNTNLRKRLTGRRAHCQDESDRRYLVTTSALNTSEATFAIAALYLIGKSRSGASVALNQVLGQISASDIGVIVSVFLIAGCLAALALVLLAKPLATGISLLDAHRLNTSVIVFIVLLTGLLMGSGGLLILAIATLVGLLPIFTGARRAQLMVFFLVPVLLFYSGYQADIVSALKLEQRLSPSYTSPDLHSIISTPSSRTTRRACSLPRRRIASSLAPTFAQ